MRCLHPFALLSLLATCGCGYTTYRVVDPERANYVHVVEVKGREILLADGRSFKIAGMRYDEALPAEIRKGLDTGIASLKRREGVLVTPTGKDNLAIVTDTLWYSREPFEGGLRHVLPARVPLYPVRNNPAIGMIWNGWVRFAPEEISPEARFEYENAEQSARHSKQGIWRLGVGNAASAPTTR